MRLKLTFVSIFFSLSIFISPVHAGGSEPADLYVVETVTTLLTDEGRLKNTYAYKSLALGTSLLRYGSLDPYGILRTLIQHNAPQLLYTAGRKFLPSQIRKQYERLVGFSFAALHAYDLITNPSRHGFGYGFGILGVWLTKQLPYFNYLDDSYQQEVKGLIYFCCREAGFYLNDTLDKESMYAFLGTLPFFMKEQTPAQLCEAEEEMLVPALPLLLTREDIIEQKMRIDDGLSSKINPHPNCSFTYQWQVTQMFNGTIDHILRAHQEALKQGKNLGIIWGEKHTSCSCYLQERELFKLAHLLGIETLYLEVIPEDYDGIRRFIANRILSNFDSETRTHAYAEIGIKGAHALQVGLQLKPAEKPTKQIPWVVPSPEYLEALEDFIENDPTLLLVKSFHHGDPMEIWERF